ncbi:MAG: DUF1593 domain-containing protein [Oscillospiraceae bacterium]|nr:DUF1593 domain-containing protein [Oscillospiraceae bacterium]
MKKLFAWLLITALCLGLAPAAFASDTALPAFEGKPRLLVTQDGEVDDMNSLIHNQLYANEFDLEGIVQTSSKLHWSGDGTTEPYRWMGTEWMDEFLDAYAEVYPNLIVHDPDYPTPDSLREITKIGNIKLEAEMTEITEGSELIKERILTEDPRPLFIEIGGGANTVARALLSIAEEYGASEEWEALYQRICENVILTAWGMQDSCYKDYIQVNWPEMRMVDVSASTLAYGYRWANVEELSEESVEKMSSAWMEEHLEKNHGALMDHYVTWGDGTYLIGEDDPDQYGANEALLGDETSWVGHAYERYDFLSEGDSPAWFLVIPNGLRNIEDLAYGGWNGRYALKKNKNNEPYRLYQAAKGNERGIAAWIAAIQSDFAMRADWCVASTYEEANHLPTVSVLEGTDLTAAPGETVTLHAAATDPDGDHMAFLWYHYPLGDTYEEAKDEDKNPVAVMVAVQGEAFDTAEFTVPSDAKPGDTLHVILECVDGGGTNPRAYQRVIITVV